MPKLRLPTPILITLVAAPVLLVAATAWISTALVPACEIDEHQRLASPDGARDLVVYSTVCVENIPNTQATLVVSGAPVAPETRGFAGVGADTELDPRWLPDGSISLTIVPGSPVFQQDDKVDGIAISYR